MSIIEKLTEGVINRDLSRESNALMDKWEKTGLLEGIEGEHNRNSMSCLLENQAKELLREASTMAGGDVIFFLDFTTANTKLGYDACDSIYGGGVVASQITGGVELSGITPSGEEGFYNLNNGYAATTGSLQTGVSVTIIASGTVGGDDWTGARSADGDRLVRFDPDLSGATVAVGTAPLSTFTAAQFNVQNDVTIRLLDGGAVHLEDTDLQIRRLTRPDFANSANLLFVVSSSTTDVAAASLLATDGAEFVIEDNFTQGTAVGSIIGAPEWDLEALGNNDACAPDNSGSAIAEIDIKVDSIAITAMTKKLRAKWTPELQQDISAYHNLDAEVELTSILSETIALEIDQEILEDLIKGAKASTYYWSRRPGKFVARESGLTTNTTLFPDFTGTVSEWYETLLETVNDVSAQIHRKTLRGGANFIVTSPEVANLLEFTNGFRASTTADENRGTAGAVKTGTISKKWDIYVDPYFPRNLILVGRKGGSFLESGYVYAPYVPLQTTPTIFDPENFTPRKGVMTRYGKKMVRPDMYGLVVVEDLLG